MGLLRSRAPRTAHPHPCNSTNDGAAPHRDDPNLSQSCKPKLDGDNDTVMGEKHVFEGQTTKTSAANGDEPPVDSHVARPGDLVIIQEHYTTLKPVTLKAGHFMNNRYGRFAHDDILGKSVGRRIKAVNPAMVKTSASSTLSAAKKADSKDKEKVKDKDRLRDKGSVKEKEIAKDKDLMKDKDNDKVKGNDNVKDKDKDNDEKNNNNTEPGIPTKRQLGAGFVHALAPTPELWSQAMDHRTQIVYPHDAALISLKLELKPGDTLVECGTGSGSATVSFARVLAPHGRIFTFDFHEQRGLKAVDDFKQLGIKHLVNVHAGVDVLKQGFINVNDGIADAVFLDLPMPYEMGPEISRVLRPDGRVCLFSPCVEQVQKSCDMLRNMDFHSIVTVTCPVKTFETREMKLETPGFDQLKLATPKENGDDPSAGDPSELPPNKRRRPNDVEDETNATSVNGVQSEKWHRLRSRTAGAERLAIGAMYGQGRHVGRVIRPNIRLHSKPFPSMKGHTSYLTFARKCVNFSDKTGTNKKTTSVVNLEKEGEKATTKTSACRMS